LVAERTAMNIQDENKLNNAEWIGQLRKVWRRIGNVTFVASTIHPLFCQIYESGL